MSWYKETAQYIEQHFDQFVETFFGGNDLIHYGRGVYVNPSPCCGHKDCFSIGKRIKGFKCFSCGEKGSWFQAVVLTLGVDQARAEIEAFTSIPYEGKNFTDEQKARFNKNQRIETIKKEAIEFYHKRLLDNNRGTLSFQISKEVDKGARAHTVEMLKRYKVGVSGDYKAFYQSMIEKGFTPEELEKAKEIIWVPEGYYVYPYSDKKGNIVRINAKLFERRCKGKRKQDGSFTYDCDFTQAAPFNKTDRLMQEQHERENSHYMSSDAFSTGDRDDVFYFAPKINHEAKKYLIVVEGENDVISVDEALETLPKIIRDDFTVWGLGGNPNEDTFHKLARIVEALDF